MGQAIAKAGDGIGPVMDTHTVTNTETGESQPQKFPFNGNFIQSTLERNIKINGKEVATIDSKVNNEPPHVPPPSYTFDSPPSNIGEVKSCKAKVLANGKKVASATDLCETCTEVPQAPPPQVQVRDQSRVYVGPPSPPSTRGG